MIFMKNLLYNLLFFIWINHLLMKLSEGPRVLAQRGLFWALWRQLQKLFFLKNQILLYILITYVRSDKCSNHLTSNSLSVQVRKCMVFKVFYFLFSPEITKFFLGLGSVATIELIPSQKRKRHWGDRKNY